MKLKNSIVLLVVILLYSSCLSEEYGGNTTGKINVPFAVKLPIPQEVQPSLRASYTDTSIENIDLLVFDKDNKYLERIKVDKSEITATATGVEFTVQMEATTENRTIHMIANARTADGLTDRINLSSITTGMLESAAIPGLQTSSLSSYTGEDALLTNIMPLVMWSRISLAGVNMITKAEDVKLLRATACIQVKKAATGDGLSDFVIERIAVDRAADQGKVTPAAYSTSPTGTPSTANPVSISTYMAYNKTFSELSATPSLYVYEKNNTATDYTSIILQAKYKNRTGYYKVVMMNGNTPWNIIRNHRYNVTITSVSGYGYTDIATAVNSAPSNDLKTEITVEQDKEYPFLIADGQYVMGATNNQIHIYGRRYQQTVTNDVELCTIYTSRGIAPTFTLSGSQTWLSDISAQGSGNVYQIRGKLNFQSAPTQVTLDIWCDNLTHTLLVNWTPDLTSVSDTDSYVVPLIGSTEKNWKVQVSDNPNWLGLHATAAAASAYPGTEMVKELTSKYSSQAYMHVLTGTSDRRAGLMMSAQVNNQPVSRKILVIQ